MFVFNVFVVFVTRLHRQNTLGLDFSSSPLLVSPKLLWPRAQPKNYLTKVDLDSLFARFVRNYDLLWHIASFFVFMFLFLSIPRSHSQLGASGTWVDN